ncbi:MAG: gas vesicle protein GvpJ [Pseudomonadota bacterium]
MEPIREREATLVDLLDRLLDKGLVLNADLVITMGDVPLIGINLKAAIAGMETMLQYGMMTEFEKEINSEQQVEAI